MVESNLLTSHVRTERRPSMQLSQRAVLWTAVFIVARNLFLLAICAAIALPVPRKTIFVTPGHSTDRLQEIEIRYHELITVPLESRGATPRSVPRSDQKDDFYSRLPWCSQSPVSYPAMANFRWGAVCAVIVPYLGRFWGGEGGDE